MGKMNILTGKCAAVLREKLHRRLDALSPKARLATVAVMSAAFAAGCLYMTATAITGFGGGNGATEMRHIEKLDLPVQESDNLYNNVYGNEKRTEE